jgi:SWI/SNF-related matrix-associated actin-dependent regulator 1 of chromatin subfamily A
MASRTELRQALGSLFDVVDEHLQGEKLPVAKGLRALNTAKDDPAYDGPLADVLFPYQKAGVTAIRASRRKMLGHGRGLGKTIQAIAAIEAEGTIPAVIVVPPSLTINWVNEFAMWTPDVYVIGDSIVAYWADALIDTNPEAIVLDESQRFKNYKANRTQAVKRIGRFVSSQGLRIALSGTPVKNDRPDELVPQMETLNVLDDVFGSRDNYYDNFYPKSDQWERVPANLDVLHEKLIDSFYARLTFADVRDQLGDKAPKGVLRQPVPVEMKGKFAAEYRQARDDLRTFLTEKNGAERADRAMRAEALVMLNTLRRLSGLAKVEGIIEYVQDLLDNGDQVIISAVHRDVTKAYAAAFNAPTIIGGMKAEQVEAGKEAFQSGEAKVLVLNIEAGGTGHTLTAGSHVVNAEFGWTPGDMDQVEGRADRIGQEELVISHWMFGTNGAETIDERLVSILNTKSQVTGAILDGEGTNMIDTSTLDSLLDWAANA